jgi:translation elongation factor EF-Ts
MKPTSLGDLPKEDAKKEEEKAKPDENEKRLLYQEFLMKENSTVLDFLKEHKSEIVDFVRLECGEFIDNEPQ